VRLTGAGIIKVLIVALLVLNDRVLDRVLTTSAGVSLLMSAASRNLPTGIETMLTVPTVDAEFVLIW